MLTIKKLFTLVLPKNTAGREWRVNQALYCPEQALVYTESKPLRNTRVEYIWRFCLDCISSGTYKFTKKLRLNKSDNVSQRFISVSLYQLKYL